LCIWDRSLNFFFLIEKKKWLSIKETKKKDFFYSILINKKIKICKYFMIYKVNGCSYWHRKRFCKKLVYEMFNQFFFMYCSVLFCSVLFCSVMLCYVLFCSVLSVRLNRPFFMKKEIFFVSTAMICKCTCGPLSEAE
jgi:hypothetical protein